MTSVAVSAARFEAAGEDLPEQRARLSTSPLLPSAFSVAMPSVSASLCVVHRHRGTGRGGASEYAST